MNSKLVNKKSERLNTSKETGKENIRVNLDWNLSEIEKIELDNNKKDLNEKQNMLNAKIMYKKKQNINREIKKGK